MVASAVDSAQQVDVACLILMHLGGFCLSMLAVYESPCLLLFCTPFPNPTPQQQVSDAPMPSARAVTVAEEAQVV